MPRRAPVALEGQPLDTSNDFSLGPSFQAFAARSPAKSGPCLCVKVTTCVRPQASQLSRFVDSEALQRKGVSRDVS